MTNTNCICKSSLLLSTFENVTAKQFLSEIYPQRKPALLRGINIGMCLEKWTPDYLSELYGDRDVKVHVSADPKMDFINKNFLYKSLSFATLIKRASEEVHNEFFLNETEMYYLRSIGNDPRKDKADIHVQFPALADDLNIPAFVPREKIFSSVFRISSPQLTLWTHYDIMDNVLIQVRGKKKAVLFPPSDVPYLYIKGDKSAVQNIDEPDLARYPEFAHVTHYEGIMEPGDILFIPALWFHNMTSLDFSVSVNVFWKHLDDQFYDKKDPYGNRDLLPAATALTHLDKALKALSTLPEEYKEFYARRMISHIQETLLTKEN